MRLPLRHFRGISSAAAIAVRVSSLNFTLAFWRAGRRGDLEKMSMTRTVALLLLVQGAQSLQLMAPSRRMAPVAPMVARFAPVSMQQDGAREREKSKGRQATIARPKPKPKEKSKEEVDKEGEWKVLLHNDDVSLALTRSALFPCNSTTSQGTASRALRHRAVSRCTPLTT